MQRYQNRSTFLEYLNEPVHIKKNFSRLCRNVILAVGPLWQIARGFAVLELQKDHPKSVF